MDNNLLDVLDGSNNQGNNRKYYVYRLVDPRTFQTFYVGKGCGDRVFQHIRNVIPLYDKDDDAISLKTKQIAEIIGSGKQVISIIHRRGLTRNEALEVEAALIDAYPGLTNIQRGHGFERGAITVEDLDNYFHAADYAEPSEKYIIIKTTLEAIGRNGSIYDATRKAWRAQLAKAKNYQYVLAVVYGIVREVYKVTKWYQDTPDRIAFEGEPTSDLPNLIGKRIPEKYRKKGAANPFIYKK